MMTALIEAQLYRDASAVKRWHVKHTLRTQTVAEHTFGMLMLLRQVCDGQVTSADMCELYERAMHHDLPELFTGDTPGPIKRAHSALGVLLDEIEQDLAPLYRPDGHLTSASLGALVKWADNMEGALWAMEEIRLGNTTMRTTVARYLGWMTSARIPDLARDLTDQVVQCAQDEFFIQPATGATLEAKS